MTDFLIKRLPYNLTAQAGSSLVGLYPKRFTPIDQITVTDSGFMWRFNRHVFPVSDYLSRFPALRYTALSSRLPTATTTTVTLLSKTW